MSYASAVRHGILVEKPLGLQAQFQVDLYRHGLGDQLGRTHQQEAAR